MNKIYKLVWSVSSESFVPASEIASGSKGGRTLGILDKLILLSALVAPFFVGDAAASCTVNTVNYGYDTVLISGDCASYTLPANQTVGDIWLDPSNTTVSGNVVLDGNIEAPGYANYYGIYLRSGSLINGSVINNGIIDINSGPGLGTSFADNYIGSIVNNRSITGVNAISNVANIGSIVNAGSITGTAGITGYPGGLSGIQNYLDASISSISNLSSGSISSTNGWGISNSGSISSIINAGSISADGGLFSGIFNDGIIGQITNQPGASISGSQGAPSIQNSGTIQVLNNAQSNLTYSGAAPQQYNVIISSPATYGRLTAIGAGGMSGVTSFGIYAGSSVTKGKYSAVLSGVSSSNLASTTGSYAGLTWTLSNAADSIWDLVFTGATVADTQASLVNSASALQSTFTLQNAVLANSFSYDCNVFGANNICISGGGRNTSVQATNGLNNTSALLIAAYRALPSLRIGVYADQNLSVNNAGSTVNLGNNTPLIGLFGAWSQRPDGIGSEVKVSVAYGQKNATVNRAVVGTSEPGSGSSQLTSQGAQLVGKYGFGVIDNMLVSPYAGIRYTQNNMGGYTEGANSSVTLPLTYSALNTNATTILAGLEGRHRITPATTAFLSAGVESDTSTSNGAYTASGISGLTPVNFNPNPVKTRPTASVGAYYDLEKNHRLGILGVYRQEPFQAVSTTTVMATYTVGL